MPKYRDGKRDVLPYLEQRWRELGVPAAMAAIQRPSGIHTDDDMAKFGKSDTCGESGPRGGVHGGAGPGVSFAR